MWFSTKSCLKACMRTPCCARSAPPAEFSTPGGRAVRRASPERAPGGGRLISRDSPVRWKGDSLSGKIVYTYDDTIAYPLPRGPTRGQTRGCRGEIRRACAADRSGARFPAERHQFLPSAHADHGPRQRAGAGADARPGRIGTVTAYLRHYLGMLVFRAGPAIPGAAELLAALRGGSRSFEERV